MHKTCLMFSIVLTFSIILFQSQTNAGWFQGKPAPEVKSFWIYELSANKLINQNNVREPVELLATFELEPAELLATLELGYMRNISTRSSLGMTVYHGFRGDGDNFGLRVRYRRWLSIRPLLSLDCSLGLLFISNDNEVEMQFPGIIGSVSFNFNDLIALKLHQEYLRYSFESFDIKNTGFQSRTYIGIQTGSKLSLTVTSAMIIFGIAFLLSPDISIGN